MNLTANDNCGSCDVCFRTMSEVFIDLEESTVTSVTDGVTLINTTVTCDFTAYPSANVTWFGSVDTNKDVMLVNDTELGTRVSTERPSLLAVNSTLVVEATGIIIRVTGPYICRVSNGEETSTIDTESCSVCFVTSVDVGVTVTLPLFAIILLAVGPLCIISTALAVFGGGYWGHRRHQLHKISLKEHSLSNPEPNETQSLEMSPKVSGSDEWMDTLLSCLPANMVVPSDSIKIIKMIGQGEFGVVYKAEMSLESTNEVVAVKTMKGIYATPKDVSKIVDEVLLMEQFRHPNVMTLVGVCVSSENSALGPSIVMPFMIHGSLLEFLRGRGKEQLTIPDSADSVQVERVQKLLLNFCLQIARGMEYLSAMKFVHRDLAARNCMIDDGYSICVGDFGLTEDIYTLNYFRQEKGSAIKLPLKWMAPESIKIGLFSEATDVWSFGVTCWEVCSSGQIPYPGLHPQHILNHVESGNRLQQPSNGACPDKLYALMMSCWESNAGDRPVFSDLVTCIDKLLLDMADYLPLSITFDVNRNESEL